jgi:ribosomal protein S6--L-glutamate ligase
VKLGILSRSSHIYSTTRLKQAAEQRGHEVRIVDYSRCYMNITSHKPAVLLGGHELVFDAIVPRIGASLTFYGAAVVRQYEMMGVYSLNSSKRSRDRATSCARCSYWHEMASDCR